MEELKTQVQRLIDAGVPEEKIGEFIQEYSNSTGSEPSGRASGDGLEMAVSHKPVQPEDPNAIQQALRVTSPYYRPILEGGGAGVGGVVGSGAAPVAGTIAGGTLGYGIGKRTADALDEYAGIKPEPTVGELASQTAKDLKTGAMYEMGGMAAVPVFMAAAKGGKYVFDQIIDPTVIKPFTTKGAQREAGGKLIAHTSAGDIFARNAEEAKKIEKQIPGLKFSQAQLTGDPGVIKLERTQIKGKGDAASIFVNRVAQNNEALRKYYSKNFGSKEGVDDLITFLESEGAALRSGADEATGRVSGMIEGLPSSTVESSGQKIVDTLSSAKNVARKTASDLYNEVPEMEIDVANMLDDFRGIIKPMNKYERKGNIPDILEDVLEDYKPKKVEGEKIVPKKKMSLGDLRGLRSEISTDLREAKTAATPNERKIKRLTQAKNAIDDAIRGAESGGPSELKRANDFFRDEYVEVYKKKTVGDILRRGPRGEQTRIPIAKIPSQIWQTNNLSAADDFLKATDKAQGIMREHAAYDLMQKATDFDGNIDPKKVNNWLAKNKRLLEKFGLTEDFNNINKAQKAANEAIANAQAYEKSVAGKILNADPGAAVGDALKGVDKGKKAAQLMNIVKKSPAAKKGLQKAFSEHIMNIVENNAKDVEGKALVSIDKFSGNLKKYTPVINEIYRGEPQKKEALKTIQRAFEIASRNTRSPIGGGPETAETLLTRAGETNFLSRTAYIIKSVFKWLGGPGRKQANEMLTKALFDPDYAEEIIKTARSKVPTEQLMETVMGNLQSVDKARRMRIGQGFAGSAAAIGDGKEQISDKDIIDGLKAMF